MYWWVAARRAVPPPPWLACGGSPATPAYQAARVGGRALGRGQRGVVWLLAVLVLRCSLRARALRRRTAWGCGCFSFVSQCAASAPPRIKREERGGAGAPPPQAPPPQVPLLRGLFVYQHMEEGAYPVFDPSLLQMCVCRMRVRVGTLYASCLLLRS